MAKRTRKAAQGTKPQPAKQYPAPKYLPRAKGGGVPSWTVGDGATLDAVARLRTQFDADAQAWKETTPNDEDLVKAVSYWVGYPLWLEQVGYWWAGDETRHSAYIALNRVHHRATEILMEAANRLGIDSAPLMESAQWCRQLLAEPEIYRATGETWPMCLETSRDSLPPGAWEAAQKGYATLVQLSVKLETKSEKTKHPVMTEPLMKIELADYFTCNRNDVAKTVLEKYPHEIAGTKAKPKYRLRVVDMPPAYHEKHRTK